MTKTYNMDCLEYMKTLKDNEFDLIIADPPYGDCDGSWSNAQRFGHWFEKYREMPNEIPNEIPNNVPSGRLHNHGRFARYCSDRGGNS